MTEQHMDLPTALLRERDRVRDEIVPAYESIGMAGKPALFAFIRPALAAAERALAEHDAAQMVAALSDLRSIQG